MAKRISWKEYGDGPSKDSNKVSLVHYNSDLVDCYIELRANGQWQWSVYSTGNGVQPNARIGGYSNSLEDAKKRSLQFIRAISGFSA